MEQAIKTFVDKDTELEGEINTLKAQIRNLYKTRFAMRRDLLPKIVDHFKLFELFPYFSEDAQKEFMETRAAIVELPSVDQYSYESSKFLYMNLSEDGLYIDINDKVVFESRLSELLSKEAVLKEAADIVKDYIK